MFTSRSASAATSASSVAPIPLASPVVRADQRGRDRAGRTRPSPRRSSARFADCANGAGAPAASTQVASRSAPTNTDVGSRAAQGRGPSSAAPRPLRRCAACWRSRRRRRPWPSAGPQLVEPARGCPGRRRRSAARSCRRAVAWRGLDHALRAVSGRERLLRLSDDRVDVVVGAEAVHAVARRRSGCRRSRGRRRTCRAPWPRPRAGRSPPSDWARTPRRAARASQASSASRGIAACRAIEPAARAASLRRDLGARLRLLVRRDDKWRSRAAAAPRRSSAPDVDAVGDREHRTAHGPVATIALATSGLTQMRIALWGRKRWRSGSSSGSACLTCWTRLITGRATRALDLRDRSGASPPRTGKDVGIERHPVAGRTCSRAVAMDWSRPTPTRAEPHVGPRPGDARTWLK